MYVRVCSCVCVFCYVLNRSFIFVNSLLQYREADLPKTISVSF